MLYKSILSALVLMAASVHGTSQPTRVDDATVAKILEIASKDNQVMDHIDVLTGRFGGRLIGSGA